MIPRETLATARIPGGETLTLVRHGADHVVMLGRDELMGTRMRFSEEQLAELTPKTVLGYFSARLAEALGGELALPRTAQDSVVINAFLPAV